MNYSVCFLDELGRTLRSEFDPFESDDEAVTYGRAGLSSSGLVEIWKGEQLMARLYRDRADLSDQVPKKPKAGQRARVSDWENEGGATLAGAEH